VSARAFLSDPERELASLSGEGVLLLVDDLQEMATWQEWLRESCLPRLPAGVGVALAGRNPPAPAWWTDPGWRPLVDELSLTGFSFEETRAYLRSHPAGGQRAEEVQALTGGHPLAVALLADELAQDPAKSVTWEMLPEVVHELLARLLEEEEPADRVLHAAALVPALDEELLAAMVPSAEPSAALESLAARPWALRGSRGVRTHELVAEILRAEFRQRRPAEHGAMLRRAITELAGRIPSSHSPRAVEDTVHVLREIPAIRDGLPLPGETGLVPDAPSPAEFPTLADWVERWEGQEARWWFEYWAGRQPEGITILRGSSEEPVGFHFYIEPSREGWDSARADPAVAAMADFLVEWAPLEPGERAQLCRFLLSRDEHQSPSPAGTRLRSLNALHAFRDPDIAFTATVVSAGFGGQDLHRLVNILPLAASEHTVGDARFFLVGHDWRQEPPVAWLSHLADRVTTGQPPAGSHQPQAVFRPRHEFHQAVRAALRAFLEGEHPVTLVDSPLMTAGDSGSPAETPVAERIHGAILDLEHDPEPTAAAAGQLLHATYLRGERSQSRVAEALGMAYGTYRRRLRSAQAILSDRLLRQDRRRARTEAS